jgi:hypothetical protein
MGEGDTFLVRLAGFWLALSFPLVPPKGFPCGALAKQYKV